MNSIIQHRPPEKAFCFAVAAVAAFSFFLSSPAHPQVYDEMFSAGIFDTVELLKKEIARDEEIVSGSMTIARLRQTRGKLQEDLPRKEKALSAIKRVKYPAIESAVQTVEKTYDSEKQIAGDPRINEAVQIRTLRAIREGLPEKKQALTDIESWLKTNPY
jgi:hypothetical protein